MSHKTAEHILAANRHRYHSLSCEDRRRLNTRRNWLKRYGLSLEDYNTMLEKQDGKCAICKSTPQARLHVDHDHKTGQIRSLLCGPCNHMLGNAKEDITLLYAAIEYLMSHNPHNTYVSNAVSATGGNGSSQHTPQVGGKNQTPTVVGSGNAVEIAGDMSLWDTVAGKFVLLEQTTIGTTIVPKL